MSLNMQEAQLIVIEPLHSIKKYKFSKEQIKFGSLAYDRDDITVESRIVSREHGIFTVFNGKYYYMDIENTNGTYINGNLIDRQSLRVSPAIELNDGDIISVGSYDENRVYVIFSYNKNLNLDWQSIALVEGKSVRIGRNIDNNIVFPTVNVSRSHSIITKVNGQTVIKDLSSVNGTIVNGAVISGPTALKNGDTVSIGAFKIFYINDLIVYGTPVLDTSDSYSQSSDEEEKISQKSTGIIQNSGVEIRVENISKVVACKKGTGNVTSNKKTILDNVSLKIKSGELIAILGGSGAGKTTFMNCVNGFEPATSGKIYINGNELYSNYNSLKSFIGYVPQQDIVFDNLTLQDMLKYTGKLRLPPDITKAELEKIIIEVMKMVDLYPQKDTYIRKLSGGQRKRASIAVELVSDPSVFFLDEPTSGLDPEAETSLMYQLRKLSSDKGKTILVITHTLQNIDLFDKVIFLAPGGKLCFYGSPAEAKEFFEVDNLTNAYEKISKDISLYVNKYKQFINEGVYDG